MKSSVVIAHKNWAVKWLCFVFFPLLAFSVHTHAIPNSEIVIKGKVSDESGEPLQAVSIAIKGTARGTMSGTEGTYTITADEHAVLVFSFIGYANIEVPVNGQTELNVRLKKSNNQLDQVVIVGYGTQRRSQVVGSVGTVKGAEITKQPVLTAAQGLQAKTSGVQVVAAGTPGSQPQVRIRGVSSITGDANPIYVVDGVITTDITNVSNSDIESVEVLKDASAQAIYGSRAGNGVILVTTKRGKTGKMHIGIDAYSGFRAATSKVKMASGKAYAQYTNEANVYDGNSAIFDVDTINNNTNWFDEITRKGIVQNYNLNISGGTEKTTYYFSAGYFKDNGIVRGNDYNRGVIRINNEYRLAPFLKLGHNLNISIVKANNKNNEFTNAYRMAPSTPVKYADGSWGYEQNLSVANPVADLEYTNDILNQVRLQGNVYGDLTPVKGLTLHSSFNFDRRDSKSTIYTPAYYIWSGQKNDTSLLTAGRGNGFYYNIDNNLTYNKTINDKHELSVTVGYSAEHNKGDSLSASAKGVPNQRNLWYLGQGDLTTTSVTNSGQLVTRASAYGRLTYTFDRRYNLSGSFRKDGSSNFPVGNKWGTFYSAGASWIITEERFMENQHIFDELKVRAGYGKVGNDNVSGLGILNGVSIQSYYYAFGGNSYSQQQAITYDQVKDATATWEPTTGTDAGIEFSVLNRRLNGSASYYNKLTSAYVDVTVPSTLGDADQTIYSRAADVRNKGVEITLNWSNKVNKDFSYFIGGNITFNKNNVEKVSGNLQLKSGSLGNGQITTYTVVGKPIGSFWVYKTDGIYQTQEEIDNSPHLTGTKPGDFKLADLSGSDGKADGVIDDNDRIFTGSYQPKTYYGINAGFSWKRLDFSVDCYGNAGNKVYNGKKAVRFGNDNIEASVAANRWTSANTNTNVPRASNTIPVPSTYYVESGSFFRINNITLGYNIPTTRWGSTVSNFRVFATAQNPVIFKKYSGYTPELPGSATSSGIELNIYPVTSTYMAGFNLSF
ncbi:TonB-linked outer membrane protein, SusC/RagA family [Chitinophaga sp. YR573]|uniref:SusC/RagA family TonB-linked outer membrane protein n=1 Tax=Chitinophaga sp. YR573 TaxID=1881040 RepID=UPI0008B2A749|nr:TonB-dependent receptor [Chitinophaga sp. YR573]SEW20293.1 TonB-linked outer membrane protein, SusC/RagA family [Chitinophaga sp. YR573]